MTDDEFAREHEDMVRGTAMLLARECGLLHALDDLVAYGFQGLLEARARFDPERGVPFAGFAHKRVSGAIVLGAERIGGLSRKTLARVKRAHEALLSEAADERGTDGAIEGFDDIAASFEALFRKMSGTLVLAWAAEEQVTPETRLATEMDRARVRRALGRLSEREQIVLRGIYFDERPLEDIGAELLLSANGVSKVHNRALGALRDALG